MFFFALLFYAPIFGLHTDSGSRVGPICRIELVTVRRGGGNFTMDSISTSGLIKLAVPIQIEWSRFLPAPRFAARRVRLLAKQKKLKLLFFIWFLFASFSMHADRRRFNFNTFNRIPICDRFRWNFMECAMSATQRKNKHRICVKMRPSSCNKFWRDNNHIYSKLIWWKHISVDPSTSQCSTSDLHARLAQVHSGLGRISCELAFDAGEIVYQCSREACCFCRSPCNARDEIDSEQKSNYLFDASVEKMCLWMGVGLIKVTSRHGNNDECAKKRRRRRRRRRDGRARLKLSCVNNAHECTTNTLVSWLNSRTFNLCR